MLTAALSTVCDISDSRLHVFCPSKDLVAFVREAARVVVCRFLKWETVLDSPPPPRSLRAPVTALAWRSDGRYLASGHEDGSCVLFDPETSEVLQCLPASGCPVVSMHWPCSPLPSASSEFELKSPAAEGLEQAFSTPGAFDVLAVCSQDGTVSLVSSGQLRIAEGRVPESEEPGYAAAHVALGGEAMTELRVVGEVACPGGARKMVCTLADLSALSLWRRELKSLTASVCALKALCARASKAIASASGKWREAAQAMAKREAEYSQALEDNSVARSASEDLAYLLATGKFSPAAESFVPKDQMVSSKQLQAALDASKQVLSCELVQPLQLLVIETAELLALIHNSTNLSGCIDAAPFRRLAESSQRLLRGHARLYEDFCALRSRVTAQLQWLAQLPAAGEQPKHPWPGPQQCCDILDSLVLFDQCAEGSPAPELEELWSGLGDSAASLQQELGAAVAGIPDALGEHLIRSPRAAPPVVLPAGHRVFYAAEQADWLFGAVQGTSLVVARAVADKGAGVSSLALASGRLAVEAVRDCQFYKDDDVAVLHQSGDRETLSTFAVDSDPAVPAEPVVDELPAADRDLPETRSYAVGLSSGSARLVAGGGRGVCAVCTATASRVSFYDTETLVVDENSVDMGEELSDDIDQENIQPLYY
eukprot:m51a1_g8737 putative anaphase-promoting complex subunit 4 (654) ;mRNA; f:25875-28693